MPPTRYSLHWLSYTLGVTLGRLEEIAARAEKCYHPFVKRQKDKERLIDNPNDELQTIQSLIRDRLLVPIPLSDIVHGCVKGRSAQTNAVRHVRQPSASSVDIRKCYPSITNRMVFRFFSVQLKLGPKVASLLTRLTTRKGHLPTGAPTSDVLTNLILAPVDKEVENIAERLDLEKTRFVDNIDYSGQRSAEAIEPTIRSLQKLGLAVPRKKVFNSGPGKAHVITGYTVNGKRVSLSSKYRHNVRAACEELIRTFRKGGAIDGLLKSLRGRVTHIGRTNPQSAAKLKQKLIAAGIPF